MPTTLVPPLARSGPDRSRGDLSAPWRHVDWVLIAVTAALAAIGVVMVFSATRGPTNPPATSHLMKQAMFVTVGSVVALVATLVDYRRLRDWAWLLYGATTLMLVAVLSPLGQQSKGAQAWFGFGSFQLQPAEFAKIALILLCGSLLAMWAGDIDLRRLALLLVVSGAPMGLILLQPDLGTVLVLVAIVLGMLAVSGLRMRYLLALSLIGLVVTVGVLNSSVLKQYQKDRLTAFLDPSSNVEATYNVDQSQKTIANGGVTGDGLFDGRQTQLGFVPEQATDFIFTVVGEELGFVGAATVLVLYGVMCWRIWRTAQLSRDALGTLVCVGVMSMIVFQVFENVGMAMGIMPVTGIPLPLLSSGGSSILATFAGLGLVLNVHMRRFR